MTTFKLFVAATLAAFLLSTTPVLAEGDAPAPQAAQKDTRQCGHGGGLAVLKSFFLQKDEAGTTRAHRWVLTALGLSAVAAVTVGMASVGALAVAAPGCISNAGECVATLKAPLTRGLDFGAPASGTPSPAAR